MLKLRLKIRKPDEKATKEVIDKFRRVLFKAMTKMEELAIDKAPFDRGFLRQQITLFPEILTNKYVLTSKAPYSEDLEFGNSPRNVKIDALEAWVQRKGIASGKDIAAVSRAIQKKIREVGVNAQPYMRPSLHEVENFWLPIFVKEEFGNSK